MTSSPILLPTSPITTPLSPELLPSHFVQALHDFFPANAPADNVSACLFFQRGAIIEVYNRDESGWWDGVTDGLRGWFPSNYVGRLGELQRHSTDYEDIQDTTQLQEFEAWRRRLLSSTTDYLLEDVSNRISDLVEDCDQHHINSNIQLVIFQVVSSIRSVLTAANTVSKDSPLLMTYPELARQRKSVLASLSKLVLKGKELQALYHVNDDQQVRLKVQEDIPTLANQLLMDMALFENLLRSITPSFPALNSSNNLRQQLVAARLSSASLIAQVVPLPDAQNIIQTILDHQAEIDELIRALLITVEEFLSSRQRATHMLEMTRKAVEAVRTFLAVVEHVCSNVGDLDYKHCSVIPEDPHLVALVLAKEAVYSSITNLVTAVRALTGPKGQHSDDSDDLYHLQSSCENVIRTTNECASCIRTCLYVEDPSLDLPPLTASSLHEMRDRLENSVDTRRNQTLSILGRKVTSLNALQRRYNSEGSGDSDSSSITVTNHDTSSHVTTKSHTLTETTDLPPTPADTPTEPWFLKQRTFSPDEVITNADGHLTGATIEALVEKLTLHEMSPAFDDLNLWKNRVLVPVRLRVYNVIKTWLETYYRYEQDDVEDQLMALATEDMQEAMPGPAKRMIDLIQRTELTSEYNPLRPPLHSKTSSSHLSLSSGSSLFSDLSLFGSDSHHSNSSSSSSSEQFNYPPINLTRSLRNALRKAINQNNLNLVHVNDFDCMELARQFTLMESALFCQITPYEMIGQEFKKKVGQSTAIHVKAMIQKSTQVTSWISDSILREQEPKRRAQMLKFWIKVGDCCLQMNNYNTLMAIRSALDSTSIRRLKRSWDHLSTKYKAMLEPIYRATDSSRNFAEYRARLKTAVAPCLPFLGVYLTDMTFIDDGNSNHRTTPSGHTVINFDKYIKTTRVLNEIDQFQIPYKLLEVEEIQRYLARCLETVEKDEQVFYNRSVALEPRQEEMIVNDIRQTISHLT
ncbi:ras guanine nucleotide exchange factor domain-containing protein [Halteromyces radiatus]|uniref:ras guanine nucleotide exchange factor domain-containing protein n=1 Tax=Halteromyces radiatus TaxID=101107 RepID=UPI0022208DDD|nr:ras guanine nucleotide exchange factor domain-containing protein [Halteromyces radiatus]KAI8086523.1 ras guanine nucleotide exchange factor domain-containing protein [Halteromyces radiatus]